MGFQYCHVFVSATSEVEGCRTTPRPASYNQDIVIFRERAHAGDVVSLDLVGSIGSAGTGRRHASYSSASSFDLEF